ncbi:MAG: hypothetical protein PHQ75_01140 [Thermoguttaceae bacterium]|nr:hypothetical protein [Thermoguttaceae bacterium]
MNTPLSNQEQLAIVKRCVERSPFAWEDFVDTFMEPVLFVVDQTIQLRRLSMDNNQRSRLCEAVFRAFRHNDFQLLREFEGRASAMTYLIILARRLVIGFLNAH